MPTKSTPKKTQLGKTNLFLNRLGLGCVGMSESYGKPNDQTSLATLEYAIELGVNHFDTADCYGAGHNERLLGKVLSKYRQEIVIASKFGFIREKCGDDWDTICGHPSYVQTACEASLKRLNINEIDLYYLHRPDPHVPIEDTVGAMSRLVDQGKVRYLGLSEINTDTLRRAHKVHTITAVQSEYSLCWREPEKDILPMCKELDISFIAFSPLARGFLSGAVKDFTLFDLQDERRFMPRFSESNLAKNCEWLKKLEEIAQEKNCKPSQLALAWMLNKFPELIAIPGTKKPHYLEDNLASMAITLSIDECENLEKLLPTNAIVGERA